MLNPALPVNIQTEALTSNHNEFNHSSTSGKSDNNRFNNVLAREVAEKNSKPESEKNTHTANETTEKITHASSADLSDTNETQSPATPNKVDNSEKPSPTTPSKVESFENTNTPIVLHTSEPSNQVIQTITPEAKHISAAAPTVLSANPYGAEIIPSSFQATIETTVISDRPNISVVNSTSGKNLNPISTMSSLQSNAQQHDIENVQANRNEWQPALGVDPDNGGKTQPAFAEIKPNIPGDNILLQSTQTANTAAYSKLLPVPDAIKHYLSENREVLQSAQTANTNVSEEIPLFSDTIKQSILESNKPWQSLQTTHLSSQETFQKLSANVQKDIMATMIEPSALFQIDSETIQQPGMNNTLQTFIQQTSQTTTSQSVPLDIQIGQPKWNGEFAQKIVWLAHQQHQVAELRLNPAHLGPVEVMLNLTQDNGTHASAQFISQHLAVREAIEAALPRLRELMAESGIQLGDVTVGSESFQHRKQDEQHPHHLANSTHSQDANYTEDHLDKAVVLDKHSGIVNTFA